MPDFFAYLIVLCGENPDFLIKTLVFGVHILISFPLYNKSPSRISSKSFFFMKLKFKLYQIHLVRHELVREMSVNSANKAFRTVPHPSIYDIRANVLHTGRCKGMTQEILRNFLVLHHSLEHSIQGIQSTITVNRFIDVYIFSSLLRNRNFLIHLVPISRLMLCV